MAAPGPFPARSCTEQQSRYEKELHQYIDFAYHISHVLPNFYPFVYAMNRVNLPNNL